MEYSIVPTERAHVAAIADRLRAGDAAEVQAAGFTPRRALWRSWRGSLVAHTAFVGEDIGAVWGVGGCPLGRIGVPWLLTTPAVERVKVGMVREARSAVALMLTVFPELHGKVDADYRSAVRFLEVLGFTLSEPFAFGPHGALFREYSMRRAR